MEANDPNIPRAGFSIGGIRRSFPKHLSRFTVGVMCAIIIVLRLAPYFNQSGKWRNANGNNWLNVSTEPVNLSFDKGLVGWGKGSDYSEAADYNVGYQPNAYESRPAGFVESHVQHPHSYAGLCQWLRADHYWGKRVRLTAFLKTENITRGACLFMHLDTRYGYRYWTSMPVLRGNNDWRQYSVVIDVPTEAQGLIYSGLLSGSGRLLMADVHIETVGKNIPLTQPPSLHRL